MKKPPAWISKQTVLAIHDWLLAEHGGAPGLRDEGLLDAALAGPVNRFAYEKPDVLALAAAYAFALTRNHPFVDGNKRVSLVVTGVFLERNGYRLEAAEAQAAHAVRALASRSIDENAFLEWLRSCTVKLAARRRAKGAATSRARKSRKK